MRTPRVIVIGAGAGGLAAAIDLARNGAAVTLLEAAATAGGKIRVDAAGIDAGPTVLTMPDLLVDALKQIAREFQPQPRSAAPLGPSCNTTSAEVAVPIRIVGVLAASTESLN